MKMQSATITWGGMTFEAKNVEIVHSPAIAFCPTMILGTPQECVDQFDVLSVDGFKLDLVRGRYFK